MPMQGPAPAQGAPQGAAPQGPPAPGSGQPGQSPAAQIVSSIQDGFTKLGSLMKQAGPSIPPEDHQLLDTSAKSFEALVQSLQGGGAPKAPQRPTPSQPMPANSNAGSKPAPY